MKKMFLLMLILMFGLSGCITINMPATSEAGAPTLPPVASTEAPTPTPFVPVAATATTIVLPTSAPVGLTVEQLMNSNYSTQDGVDSRNYTLINGVYQTGPDASVGGFYSVRMSDQIAFGDLNGDGQPEAVVLLFENYGGTGTFIFMSVITSQNGQPVQLATLPIGEMTIEQISITGNEIRLAGVTYGPSDPHCCPSMPYTKTYAFVDNQLYLSHLTTFTPVGSERVITITSPADFSGAAGSLRLIGNVSIAPFENTLAFRIYDGLSNNELAAGPITIAAPDLGAPGTFDVSIGLSISPSTGWIRVELQDISAADGSLISMDSVLLHVP